jgi:SAM-dependent methyltransferase
VEGKYPPRLSDSRQNCLVTDDHLIAEAWDAEYEAGRYRDEPPLPFVDDILEAAGENGLVGQQGVYIGCGNGRNYLPLVAAGLDLIGLDVSRVAIDDLAKRLPQGRGRLVHGQISKLPPGARYSMVIGIQVFQHGNQAQAHQHIEEAQSLLGRGGIFCARVNATGTDLVHDHEVVERDASGSFTVRYLAGPKAGLMIHFFAADELAALFAEYRPLLAPRLVGSDHELPARGRWLQWEAIWKKTVRAPVAPPSGARGAA